VLVSSRGVAPQARRRGDLGAHGGRPAAGRYVRSTDLPM